MTVWPYGTAAMAVAAVLAVALGPLSRGLASSGSRWLAWPALAALGATLGLGASLAARTLAELAVVPLFGACCAALTAVDLAVQRLPDSLVAAAAGTLVLGLGVVAVVSAEPSRWGRALLGGVALFAAFLVLALISPSQLGLGDVKLAGALGIFLGWSGWRTVLYGGLFAFLLSVVVGLALIVSRRGSLKTQYPFGPLMIAGAVVAAVVV